MYLLLDHIKGKKYLLYKKKEKKLKQLPIYNAYNL